MLVSHVVGTRFSGTSFFFPLMHKMTANQGTFGTVEIRHIVTKFPVYLRLP